MGTKKPVLSYGDKVVIIGGKYKGCTGHVVKLTEMMCAIRLSHGIEVVRIMSHNIELRSVMMGGVKEEQLHEEICPKQCCREQLDALVAAKNQLKNMKEQMEELVVMMNALTTEK
jgi:ribosomal protein L24